MYSQQVYEKWAPPQSPWSAWAKPVLFAQLGRRTAPGEHKTLQTPDVEWAPPASANCAVVVDLPEEMPFLAGVALAGRGYQPVPLYNCCDGPSPVLDMRKVLSTLCHGSEMLARLPIPATAPPAFLIDARRFVKGSASPGSFDNRWIVLPQDFPSAAFLTSRGIERVVLYHDREAPRDDLAHVLRRWQEAGLPIEAAAPGKPPREITVKRPSIFRSFLYTFFATIGLRHNSAGGFGGVIPVSSHSYG
jgi:hypothetical protein